MNKSKASSEQNKKQLEKEAELYDTQYDIYTAKIEGLNAYRKAIIEDDDSYVDSYPEFSNLYLQYLSSMRNIDNKYDSDIISADIETSTLNNKAEKSYYQSQLNEYKTLINSIVAGTSKFSSNSNSFATNLFEEYITTYEQYNASSSSETDAAKAYKNNKLAEYKKIVSELEEEISELTYERRQLRKQANNVNIIEENYDNSLKSLYYKTINEIDNNLLEYETKLKELEAKKRNNLSSKTASVIAEAFSIYIYYTIAAQALKNLPPVSVMR